jgi:hypothetical protein
MMDLPPLLCRRTNPEPEIAITLLRSGADVSRRDNSGLTPLMRATSMMITADITDTTFLNLNVVAFELVKNKAFMTKVDVAMVTYHYNCIL